jgi:hypothetical protein
MECFERPEKDGPVREIENLEYLKHHRQPTQGWSRDNGMRW